MQEERSKGRKKKKTLGHLGRKRESMTKKKLQIRMQEERRKRRKKKKKKNTLGIQEE